MVDQWPKICGSLSILNPPKIELVKFLNILYGVKKQVEELILGNSIDLDNMIITGDMNRLQFIIPPDIAEYSNTIINGFKQVLSVNGIYKGYKIYTRQDHEYIIDNQQIPQSPQYVQPQDNYIIIKFTTPVSIKYHEKYLNKPHWAALLARSIDRLIGMGYDINKKAYMDLFKNDPIHAVYYNISKYLNRTYSKSTKQSYNQMGILGEMYFKHENIWSTYKLISEALKYGIGKWVNKGMGRGNMYIQVSK